METPIGNESSGDSLSEKAINGSDASVTRRHFVKSAIATGLVAGVGQHTCSAESRSGDMIYRQLGRTGEKVSAIGLGGYHLGNPEEQEGIKLIRRAIDSGITFMD